MSVNLSIHRKPADFNSRKSNIRQIVYIFHRYGQSLSVYDAVPDK